MDNRFESNRWKSDVAQRIEERLIGEASLRLEVWQIEILSRV
ncbi:MAG: hypothetical protein AAGB46_00870 [Verrucomicrobiota bacterium]